MKNALNATRTMTPSWDLLKPSISLVREHYLPVIYLFFLPGLLGVLGSTLIGTPDFTDKDFELTQQQMNGVFILALGFVWQVFNLGPLTLFQLRGVDKKVGSSLAEFYKDGLRYDLRLIGYYIVFGLLFILGLILFIIPGLIVLRRYFLAPYYLVDRNLSIREALKQSGEASKPYSASIWGVIGVQIALVIFGSLIQSIIPLIGILIGEVIVCLYLFLGPLRYREIEPRKTVRRKKTTAKA